MRHLKLALRTLFRTPFVTAVAVLSLALGIGANAAIYSMFDQMLVQPLPVQEPDRLINLAAPGPKPGSQSCNQAGPCEATFSYPMFKDLEARSPALSGLAAHMLFGVSLSLKGEPVTGDGVLVSGSYFPTLGLRPALGRLLSTRGRSDPRGALRHGTESRLLAGPARVGPGRAGADHHRQWPPDGDRGRRPAGLRGDHPGRAAHGVRADHDAGAVHPLGPPGRPAELLGLRLRAAQAGGLAGAGRHRAQRRVPPHHQRGGGAAAGGHERPDPGAVQGQGGPAEPGTPGSELGARGGQDPAAHAASW